MKGYLFNKIHDDPFVTTDYELGMPYDRYFLINGRDAMPNEADEMDNDGLGMTDVSNKMAMFCIK